MVSMYYSFYKGKCWDDLIDLNARIGYTSILTLAARGSGGSSAARASAARGRKRRRRRCWGGSGARPTSRFCKAHSLLRFGGPTRPSARSLLRSSQPTRASGNRQAIPLDDDASVDDPPPQPLTTVGNDESRLYLRNDESRLYLRLALG
jgi:hypothetical protein